MASTRISASFTPDLLSRVDAYCKANSLARSTLFALAVTEWLDAKDKTVVVKKSLADLFKVLYRATTDELSGSELKQELDRLQISFDELQV